MKLLDSAKYMSENRHKNERTHGGQPCILCGHKVSDHPDHWIHLTDVDMIVPRAVTEPQLTMAGYTSKGLHPVGSSCVKKLPKTYVIT